MHKKILYSIIVLLVIVLMISVYIFFQKTNGNTATEEKPKESVISQSISSKTIKLNEHISLMLNTTHNSSEETTQFQELVLYNASEQDSALLFSTQESLKLHTLENEDTIIRNKDGSTIFGVYEYSNRDITSTFSYERKGSGRVIFLDKQGNIQYTYETEYIFEKLQQQDGILYVYEKLLHDPTQLYPRHLKPYYLIQKQYSDGEFKEIGRKYFEPINDLK